MPLPTAVGPARTTSRRRRRLTWEAGRRQRHGRSAAMQRRDLVGAEAPHPPGLSEMPTSSMICFARTRPTPGMDSSSAETFILPTMSLLLPSAMTSARDPCAYLSRFLTAARSRRAVAAFSSACCALLGGERRKGHGSVSSEGRSRFVRWHRGRSGRGMSGWTEPSESSRGLATRGCARARRGRRCGAGGGPGGAVVRGGGAAGLSGPRTGRWLPGSPRASPRGRRRPAGSARCRARRAPAATARPAAR